jgi:hypothetical protein
VEAGPTIRRFPPVSSPLRDCLRRFSLHRRGARNHSSLGRTKRPPIDACGARNGLSWRNTGVEHANPLILKNQSVILRGGIQRVKLVRPIPDGLVGHSAHFSAWSASAATGAACLRQKSSSKVAWISPGRVRGSSNWNSRRLHRRRSSLRLSTIRRTLKKWNWSERNGRRDTRTPSDTEGMNASQAADSPRRVNVTCSSQIL